MNKKLGFIGCGKMASAIIGGVISSKFLRTITPSKRARNSKFNSNRGKKEKKNEKFRKYFRKKCRYGKNK